ncbi:MAG: HD-GYP domain-containing protein [Longimicrobiales bacterium]
MREATVFLGAFGQALSTMMLYGEGHPSRERGLDAAYRALGDLRAVLPDAVVTFLADEMVVGRTPLREPKNWEWASRLSDAGIQRIEFTETIDRETFATFLDELVLRLTAGSTAEALQMRPLAVRFGAVGVRGEAGRAAPAEPVRTAEWSFGVETETIRWVHDEVRDQNSLHLSEAEAVVRSLAVAMHADQQLFIPLLRLRSFDEYTTTHALNVAVLGMAFAEFLGLPPGDVRAFGVAGLLHDLGKVNIPIEVLTKPGKLTTEERALMNQHPSEGARILLDSPERLELAAVVAYEHHIMIDGGGYPDLRFRRDCHFASRLVHLCDVYDALRTKRPYRDAWSAERVMDYVQERAGTEFDAELAGSFVRMMRLWEPGVVQVTPADEGDAAAGGEHGDTTEPGTAHDDGAGAGQPPSPPSS